MKPIKREVLQEWNEEFPILKPLKIYNLDTGWRTALCLKHDFFVIGIELDPDRWTGESYDVIIQLKGLWYDQKKLYSEARPEPDPYLYLIKRHFLSFTSFTSDNIPSARFRLKSPNAQLARKRVKLLFGDLFGENIPASILLKLIQKELFEKKFIVNNFGLFHIFNDWFTFKMALATYFNDKKYKDAVMKEVNRYLKRWDPDHDEFFNKSCMSIDEWKANLSMMFDNREEFMKKISETLEQPEFSKLNNSPIINDLDTLKWNYYQIIKSGPVEYLKYLLSKIIRTILRLRIFSK